MVDPDRPETRLKARSAFRVVVVGLGIPEHCRSRYAGLRGVIAVLRITITARYFWVTAICQYCRDFNAASDPEGTAGL